MTETRAIIDQLREATPDQMAVLQDGVEDSIDHIVGDTIQPGSGYSGLACSFGGNVVTVGVGRLYVGGKVYAFDTALVDDLTLQLPGTENKAFVIVGYGTEQDNTQTPVSFLVESLSTPAAPVFKPQPASTEHQRLAVVSVNVSSEAVVPVAPGYGTAVLIAHGTLGPTGITSLVQNAAAANPNLADVDRRLRVVESFDAVIGPEISTLSAQLAALANTAGGGAAQQQITARILLSIADLDSKVGIPATAADADADYLLDGTYVDLTNPIAVSAGGCKVMEGIRFPDAAADDAVLSIFSPYDPAAQKLPLRVGKLIPTYTRYLRMNTGPVTDSVLGNAYQFNPIAYTQKTEARTRIRYGSEFTVCTNSAFWQSGTYDPITSIFTLLDGETFKADFDPTAGVYSANTDWGSGATGLGQSHVFVRLEEYWTDTVDETYWSDVVQAPVSISGYHIAESWQVGQDQWIDAVGFYVNALDTQGDVTVVVCQAQGNAAPDPSSALAVVTIPFASLTLGENVAALPAPVLAEAGERVSVVLVTTGAHKIGTTAGPNFPQGTFFYLAPSGFAQGDLTRHLALNVYSCKFAASAASIQLANLQLAGGITSIDVLAGMIVPASTALFYEVQINGVWVSLTSANTGALNAGGSLPPNLPLRVTMTGSPDMMPLLNMAASNSHVSRPATALAAAYPAAPRTPPVTTSNVHVIVRYESFDPNYHSASCVLLTGTGFTVQTQPSSFSDQVTSDGATVRTYAFTLAQPVAAFKTLHKGTTSTLFKTFHIAKYQDYVQ